MKTLVFALLFATMNGSGQGGSLWLRGIGAGMHVLVDGIERGTSASDGATITGITPGPHRIAIRSDDGREAGFNVKINDGERSEITVSPLGFRKLNKPSEEETSVVRLTSLPLDAHIDFRGGVRENHDATELTFDNIPVGKYPMVISAGGNVVRGDVDVAKGVVVTIDAATLRIIDTKPRPHRLQLNEPNDSLRLLGIPTNWKNAIRTALPSSVSIIEAASSGNTVKVRLKVPDDRMAYALLRSLQATRSFAGVQFGGASKDRDGWIADFTFTFAG